MKEIKIQYGSVEHSLNQFRTAIQAFKPSINVRDDGKNSLETMDELVEVCQLMEQLFTNYVGLLQKSAVMSENAVESMRETDAEVSSTISSGKGVVK
jgi:Family of unknown function (DUF5344)